MREHLFRGFAPNENGTKTIIINGKKIKGDWQEGGIVHQTDYYGLKVDRYYIIDGTTTQDYDIGVAEQVIPETVGEFTGLTDKNGKNIFEWDIVYGYEKIFKSIVFWNDQQCGIFPFGNERTSFYAEKSEVIGTIFDEVKELCST